MTFIGSWFSLGSPNLKTVVMCGETPPNTVSSFMYIDSYYSYPKGLRIYVPDDAIDAYKQKWASLTNDVVRLVDFIHPMSEYHS